MPLDLDLASGRQARAAHRPHRLQGRLDRAVAAPPRRRGVRAWRWNPEPTQPVQPAAAGRTDALAHRRPARRRGGVAAVRPRHPAARAAHGGAAAGPPFDGRAGRDASRSMCGHGAPARCAARHAGRCWRCSSSPPTRSMSNRGTAARFRKPTGWAGAIRIPRRRRRARSRPRPWRRVFWRRAASRVATARGGNVIGGGDFAPRRLVPDVVRAARAGTPLTLRNPEASRPWQHVLDCPLRLLHLPERVGVRSAGAGVAEFRPASAASRDRGGTRGRRSACAWRVHKVGCTLRMPARTRRRHWRSTARLARRMLGWSDRLSGKRMIATTAAWYQAWAHDADMRAVTERQIAKYRTLR